MDDISINSNTVDKLITEIIKLEKKFAHNKSMKESKKRNQIREVIRNEVKADVD